MKVHVDPNVCGGTGLCVDTCPEVFELNDENISTVRIDEIPSECEQTCREAADICPTRAITIEQ